MRILRIVDVFDWPGVLYRSPARGRTVARDVQRRRGVASGHVDQLPFLLPRILFSVISDELMRI